MPSKFNSAEKEIGKADQKQRQSFSTSWFLDPATRLYPWRAPPDGKPSRALLIHAKERASQNHHPDIAKKAHSLLSEHFPGSASGGDDNGIEAADPADIDKAKAGGNGREAANGKAANGKAADPKAGAASNPKEPPRKPPRRWV
ncbi:MAG: hypothetical protein WB679_05345 [Terracidiphilus sp.]